MKKTCVHLLALILAMVMLLSNANVLLQAQAVGPRKQTNAEPTETEEVEDEEAWLDNVLAEEVLEAFSIKLEKIYSVTFLDNLDDAPKRPWNLGEGASPRVKGWIEWNGGMAEIYIAAEGGINGEKSSRSLFSGCKNLEIVQFNGAYHTDKAETLEKMFYNCGKLEEVDVETLDTSSATNMSEMFRGCASLEEINVENFNTENVKNMYCMFSTCTSVELLDLSNFDTSKVTNMEGMFRWCESLEYLDLTGWNMKRVKTYSNFMDPGISYDGKPWKNLFK